MENQPVIHLEDSLYTDYSGIKRLFNFYHQASEYYNTTIYIDLYNLNWLDANLSALFGSILHKLSIENNLKFSTDINFLKEKFGVLFRNGFLYSDSTIIDEQKSTITFMNFSTTDKVGFVNYIENDLLTHRGMPDLSAKTKEQIIDSLIEVYCNIQIHSKSENPFFVCGQFFPKKSCLVFSMVDLGIGFLPAINEKTKGEVCNSLEAIKWAITKGNSTKIKKPGGKGLFDLYEYFKGSNGNLQIITGDTFWSVDLESTVIQSYKFDKPFVGSILNLFFNCN
jgi:hypothetical protein